MTSNGKKTTLVFFLGFVIFVIFVSERGPWAAFQTQEQKPTEAQQRPVFRGGTHFVRVDAYPIEDGKIVTGLTPEDFEILEDGTRQTIESFDFIRFDTFTPEAVRRDPRSQQEGFDLAGDPRYRVFVIVVNVRSAGIYYIQDPLTQFLDRVLGASDLFGLLTTSQSAHDLVLGQKSTTARELIADFWRSSLMDRQPADEALDQCGPAGWGVKGLYALDQTYVSLESLVQQLGSLRQERKNLIFVSNGLSSPPPKPVHQPRPGGGSVPKIGVAGGRIGIGDNSDMRPGTSLFCSSEIQRLTSIDFEHRFRDLLTDARRQNVSVYAITPAGLQAPMTLAGMDRVDANNDSLLTLANETGGIAIVNTNDLTGGMRRIGDDLAAYYVLGYYTTNTKWDGNIRKIQVRNKRTGKAIRARREYRGPTAAEIAALSVPPAPRRPAPPQPVVAPSPGPALLGEPLAYRVAPRRAPEPSSSLEFDRTDRIRVEWPVLRTLDRRDVRVLDRAGKPLPIDLRLSEDGMARAIAVELPLAALARGEYAIELHAVSGDVVERRVLVVKVR